MLHIERADYVADYKIKVNFNDGFSSVVDFEETLQQDSRPIVRKLLDLEQFQNFTISANTILWAVGVDFAPEFVRSLASD